MPASAMPELTATEPSGSRCAPSPLAAAIRTATGTPPPFVGIWERVSSTNDLAKATALDAGPVRRGGSVFVAGSQTHGRGRFGRTWVSPPGGLYLSALVEPPPGMGGSPNSAWSLLPLAAGVALARAVRQIAGVPAEIRWPNDLDWDGRKVAGVLAEIGFRRDSPQLAVVGFGVNLAPVALSTTGGRNAARPALPPGARPPGWLPPGVDRIELACALVASLHRAVGLLAADAVALRGAWESLSPTARGCPCEVRLRGARAVRGETGGLAPAGALQVRTPGGGIQVITASEAVRILHARQRPGSAPGTRPA